MREVMQEQVGHGGLTAVVIVMVTAQIHWGVELPTTHVWPKLNRLAYQKRRKRYEC